MFWAIAAAALLIAALVAFAPLLRGKTLLQPAALALIFLLPVAGLWLYHDVGTPAALEMQSTPHPMTGAAATPDDIDQMIASLRGRLTRTAADLDGWILLARTLKTLQRYPEALEALQVAHGLAPDDPVVMTELAEARIFVTNDGRIDPDSVLMLERALELDPQQQKALWLLGIADAQSGNLEGAVARWESLLAMLEPGSAVAQSLQGQIDEARRRLGLPVETPAMPPAGSPAETVAAAAPTATTAAPPPAAPEAGTAGGWAGTPVRVSVSDAARTSVPAGATLYVVVRTPGPAMGPPLGVRRLNDPVLPLDLTITDQDSMLAERRISLESEIQLQARISLTGSPAARSGDWQSKPVTVPLDASGTVDLVIDQKVE